MKKHLFLTVLVSACALLFLCGPSSATMSQITGYLWDPNANSSAPGGAGNSAWNQNARYTNLGAPTALSGATATFLLDKIDSYTAVTSSYGTFLNGSGNGLSGTVATMNWLNNTTFYTASNYLGSFFQFSWTETFSTNVSELIKINHDDGVYLTIDGVVVSGFTSSETQQTNESATVALSSGTHTFVLNYGGVNGQPEVLQLSETTTSVPEPGTLLLLGAGLVGLTAYRRRVAR